MIEAQRQFEFIREQEILNKDDTEMSNQEPEAVEKSDFASCQGKENQPPVLS